MGVVAGGHNSGSWSGVRDVSPASGRGYIYGQKIRPAIVCIMRFLDNACYAYGTKRNSCRNDQIAHDNRFGVWMRRIVFLIFAAYESRKFPVSIVIELFADTPYSRTGPSRGVSPHPEAAR